MFLADIRFAILLETASSGYRSEERRVGTECRYWRDWSSDVCSSDLIAYPRRSKMRFNLFGRDVFSRYKVRNTLRNGFLRILIFILEEIYQKILRCFDSFFFQINGFQC